MVLTNITNIYGSSFFLAFIRLWWFIDLQFVWLGVISQPQKAQQPDAQQGSSFTLQLFQRTPDETLDSFQKSIHEDMRNLHIEILRQFHMQEVNMVLTSLFPLLLFFPQINFWNYWADGNVKRNELNFGKPSRINERS